MKTGMKNVFTKKAVLILTIIISCFSCQEDPLDTEDMSDQNGIQTKAIIGITLDVTESTIKLGDPYNIAIGGGFIVTNTLDKIEFRIAPKGQMNDDAFILQDTRLSMLNKYATAPGFWDIKALLYYEKPWGASGYNIKESETVSIEVRYSTAKEIKESHDFWSKADEAWNKMKNDVRNGIYTEYGFWVYMKTDQYQQGSFFFNDMFDRKSKNSCHDVISVAPSSPYFQNVSDPLTSGCYPVAYFHTHTALNKDDCICEGYTDCQRPAGFTYEDEAWSEKYKMPLFVYEYINTRYEGLVTTKDLIDGSADILPYDGVERRPTPGSIDEITFSL